MFNFTQKGGENMQSNFLSAEDVAKELSVSKTYAYRIIRQLNSELAEKGYITVSGRINRKYFSERLYGIEQED